MTPHMTRYPGGGGLPLGGEMAHEGNPLERIQLELYLSSVGGGNAGSGDRVDGGLYWGAEE